jgi:hypothetical protein
MTLTQNEKRKQWLTRGPIQRAIDHAKLRAKLFSKAQNLDKDTILVSKIKVDEIYDYSFASIIDFPLADIECFYKTPVLIGTDNDLLFGINQINYAKEKWLKTVNCVYIDALQFKTIDLCSLEDQFSTKQQSWLYFTYELYNVFIDNSGGISFEEFCNEPREYFNKPDKFSTGLYQLLEEANQY